MIPSRAELSRALKGRGQQERERAERHGKILSYPHDHIDVRLGCTRRPRSVDSGRPKEFSLRGRPRTSRNPEHYKERNMPTVIETAKAATIAYNDKNWDKVKAVFAEKGVYDEKGTGRRIQGIGQIIEAWQGWGKAIPDSKATFVAEYASGETAILEVVWKGVHTGSLQTPTGIIAASNKRIEVPACQVFKVEGGKVKSFTHYFDMVTLLTQIGAFKG